MYTGSCSQQVQALSSDAAPGLHTAFFWENHYPIDGMALRHFSLHHITCSCPFIYPSILLPPCCAPQVIYDLLVRSSGPLELREDPDQGVCVAGLKHIQVTSAAEIMVRLQQAGLRARRAWIGCSSKDACVLVAWIP
jgi:hypothetical protein